MSDAKLPTVIDWSDGKIIQTLKKTVAQGATDEEFMMFAELCKASKLNPFKKEVWFIKTRDGKPQIMTGINGFFTIANNNPAFDGIQSGLIDKDGEHKTQSYPKDDFIGAWCRVYRKDRSHPVEAVAMLSEYKKGSPIWSQMKRVMIIKCAESVALRKAFPQELNGLYTQEEMPDVTPISQTQAPVSNPGTVETSAVEVVTETTSAEPPKTFILEPEYKITDVPVPKEYWKTKDKDLLAQAMHGEYDGDDLVPHKRGVKDWVIAVKANVKQQDLFGGDNIPF